MCECDWVGAGCFSKAIVRYSGSSIIIVSCGGSELIVFVEDAAEQLRPVRTRAQIDRTQLVKTLNQLRGETDMGVVADVILSIGFTLKS